MAKIAFIGLGTMGYPMAGHLQNAGHDVTVFNRTRSVAQKWQTEFNGSTADTPKLAAQNAEAVFLCVGKDSDVEEVVLEQDGAIAGMEKGRILVDHTTTSADLAKLLDAQCQIKQIGFIDAPVSGGQAGAEQGTLSIMAGGDQEVFEKAKVLFAPYTKVATLIGPVGSGQLCKMVNQICIAGVVQGLAEGLHFAQQSHLDTAKVLSVISQGAAQSWQMNNRADTMTNDFYDYGFAVDWMRKDLGIALQEGRNNGAALPLTALVDQFYGDVQSIGGGRWDTSSLLKRLQHLHTARASESDNEQN